MNSRQRRELRRFIQRKLYEFVYERDYEGCMEFDLYPSKAKMYIDYPSKENDNIVYVKIPSFHLVNPRSKDVGIEGSYTIKMSNNPRLLSFREVPGIQELTPFEQKHIDTLHHGRYPQFILPIDEEESYVIREDYNGDVKIKHIKEESEGEIRPETRVTLEDLLNDTRIPKQVRTGLAFNIDLFEKANESEQR
jgi:hypothetical protein